MSSRALVDRLVVVLATGAGVFVAGEVPSYAIGLLVLLVLGQVVPPALVPAVGLDLTALTVGGPRLAWRGVVRGTLVSVGWPWPVVSYWFVGAWRSRVGAALVCASPLLLDVLAILEGLVGGGSHGPAWAAGSLGAGVTLLVLHLVPWGTEAGLVAPVVTTLRSLRAATAPQEGLSFEAADDLVFEGRVAEVSEHADALLREDRTWHAYELAALAAEFEGRPGDAARLLGEAFGKVPEADRGEVARWRAELLLQQAERTVDSAERQGCLELARTWMDVAADLGCPQVLLDGYRALELALDGQLEEARAIVDRLAGTTDGSPILVSQLLLTRACVVAATGDLALARRDLEQATALLPHHPRVTLARELVLDDSLRA